MSESPRVRLAAFAAALGLVLVGSYGLGAATGDLVLDRPAPADQPAQHGGQR